MQSGADSIPPTGHHLSASTTRPVPSIFSFLRRRNPATARDEAITTWGIVRRDTATSDRFSGTHFAAELVLRSPEGAIQPLETVASPSSTTLIVYIGEGMALLPGLEHRLHRRASTLGPGVRLLCVTPAETSGLTTAYVDVSRACARINDGLKPPALISVGSDGRIFDLQTDADALLDWLWNDPHPRSRRASDQ
jgi:hypothetical protein